MYLQEYDISNNRVISEIKIKQFAFADRHLFSGYQGFQHGNLIVVIRQS